MDSFPAIQSKNATLILLREEEEDDNLACSVFSCIEEIYIATTQRQESEEQDAA